MGSDKPPRKKAASFPVTRIKPTKQRVPKYRFHHVEISKNILTPSTMMKFIPHLGDLSAAQESTYFTWIEQLAQQDEECGLPTIALDKKRKEDQLLRDEYATTFHPYIDRWIQNMGLVHCNKPSLIRYVASQAPDDDKTITLDMKEDLLESDIGGIDSSSHRESKAFTEAFDRVFGSEATLKDVLVLNDAVDTLISENEANETVVSQRARGEDLLHDAEQALATYTVMGCLICFAHDCEHGHFDRENNKNSFSVEVIGRLPHLLKKKWIDRAKNNPGPLPNDAPATLCINECFQGPHTTAPKPREWNAEELQILRSMFATLFKSSVQIECSVATILGRKCWDVREKLVALNLTLPDISVPAEQPTARNIHWYDRIKKVFTTDWNEWTISHDYQRKEIIEPCHHDGPCSSSNKCPCAIAKHMCERFCQCSAETCPYKFTGCACHSAGKTCYDKQKEGKPCICVLLNRECDPVLCKGCGAAERANQLNAHDDALHATGCQNVAMQRGVSKAVLMGKSQLEACGYGLFTAEDIGENEFVIEYSGELITNDEGVRREARRGNVFDESKNTSYLFTLLETEGTWVDAAIYGNLSRYINHAGEGDKKGANIIPKILYVNGEYRIRFSATRDIKAGEELFFNYGDNFPNLTKKLLEEKDAAAAGKRKYTRAIDKVDGDKVDVPKRKPGRPPSKSTMAKNKFASSLKPGRPRGGGRAGGATKQAPLPPNIVEDPMDLDSALEIEEEPGTSTLFSPSAGRRKPGRRSVVPPLPEEEDDDYDEYRPEVTDSQEDIESYTLARDRRRRNRGEQNPYLQHLLSGEYESEIPRAVAGPGAKDAEASPAGKVPGKRGGARPGAGRKRKNPRPTADASRPTTSEEGSRDSEEAEEEEDEVDESNATGGVVEQGEGESDDFPLVETGRGHRTRGSGKRKARESVDEDEDEGEDEEKDDSRDVSELGGGAASESSESDQSVIDRSKRKRQKPARYRADE